MGWRRGCTAALGFVVAVSVFAGLGDAAVGAAGDSLSVGVEQSGAQADPTSTATVRFVVTFSRNVTDFETEDLVVGGTATAAVSSMSTEDARVFVVDVLATTDGTISVTVGAAVAHDDEGTANEQSTSADNEVTVDTIGPAAALEQSAGQSDPTNVTTISFTLAFDEPPVGLEAADIELVGDAPRSGVELVAQTARAFELQVTTAGDGSVLASLPAGAVTDAAGNPGRASTGADNEITVITSGLGVGVEQGPEQADPAMGPTVVFTVGFIRPVTGFDQDDVVLTGTAAATEVTVAGGPKVYAVTVSGFVGDGTLTASVGASAATDAAGNVSLPAVSSDATVIVDTTPSPPPALIRPLQEAALTDLTPAFDWGDVADVTGVTYRFELDGGDCDFIGSLIDEAGLTASMFVPTTVVPRGPACWRVTARDGAGNTRTSATRALTIQTGVSGSVDVAGQVGIARTFQSFGESCVADVNGDSNLDLFVSNHGGWPWQLYHGSNSGNFTEAAVGTFPRNDRHGCAVADFDNNGQADIYTAIGACSGGKACTKANELWLQAANGTFTNAGTAWGVADRRGRGRSAVVLDINHDAWPDLAVGNEKGVYYPSPNRVFLGGPSGMTELVSPATADIGGESVATADYDGDGWDDLLVATGARGAKLYRNVNGTTFVDVTVAAGLTLIPSAWDAELADINRDGKPDLVVVERTKVHVRLGNGTDFRTAALTQAVSFGRDVAVADADGDLFPDLYVVLGASAVINTPDLLLINDRTPGAGFASFVGLPDTAAGGGDSAQAVPDWRGSGRSAFLVTNGDTRNGPRQLVTFTGPLDVGGPPPPPVPTTTLTPTTVAVVTGTGATGGVEGLKAAGGMAYSVKSTKPAGQTSQVVSWRADVPGVPRELGLLSVQYSGSNSRECLQTVSLWNWATNTWVGLNTRLVGPTVRKLSGLLPPGTLADYVGGTAATGTVRVGVSCTQAGTVITAKGDLLKVTYGASAPGGPLVVATPTISPPGGTFPEEVTGVTMTTATPGAAIHYTLDGTEPSTASPAFTSPLTIGATATLKAKAFMTGMAASTTSSAVFTIAPGAPDGTRTLVAIEAAYDFASGSGTVVPDLSGKPDPIDLVVEPGSTVTWLDGGVRLDAASRLRSSAAVTRLRDNIVASDAFSVELWVKPKNTTQSNAQILTMSTNATNRNISLRQQGARYEALVRTASTTAAGALAPLSASTIAAAPVLDHLLMTRNTSGQITWYRNGEPAGATTIAGALSNWGDFRLTIGAENGGGLPWLGEVHYAAIYSRALTASEVAGNFAAGSSLGP